MKKTGELLALLETRSVDALAELASFYFFRRKPARGTRWGRRGASPAPGFRDAAFFVEFFESYKRLNAAPGFGDFGHDPRRRGTGPAAACRIPVKRGGANALREAADYFLYAPGPRGRRLVFDARGGGAAAADLAGDLAVYALAKAAWLGLRLETAFEADRTALTAPRRRRLHLLGLLPALKAGA